MISKINELSIELMAIEELKSIGYIYIHGIDLAPDSINPERQSYSDILLMGRVEKAITRLNPDIPADIMQNAARKLSRIASSNLLVDNEEFHKMLVDGVPVEYRKGSDLKGDYARIVVFDNLLTTAQIIEELIQIARDINASEKRGEDLGLSEDELAFYDALETNDSAVKVLGDDLLRTIAREIADKVRQNATIDFTIKETARARIMVIVRRILNKYGYPPDKQQAAVDLVMKQAENLADVWAES